LYTFHVGLSEKLKISGKDCETPHLVSDTAPTAPPRVLALLPGGLAFVLYLVTCSPTINFTDSGELITVAWTAGIAHPSGYPLYTLIGTAFSHLPFGDNPAWRMNVLSALFAAAAVSMFYAVVADTFTATFSAFALQQQSTANRGGTQAGGRTGRTAGVDRNVPTNRRVDKRVDRQGDAKASANSTKNQARATSTTQTAPSSTASVTNSGSRSAASEQDEGSGTSEGWMAWVAWLAAAGGLAAAGLLAVSLTFWNWATQAKFYTLHFMFVAALLWLALRARTAFLSEHSTNISGTAGTAGSNARTGSVSSKSRGANSPADAMSAISAPRWSPTAWPSSIRLLHLLLFTVGLSLTNHFLTVLLLPGLAVILVTPLRNARRVWRSIMRHAVTLVIAGLLPLLLYLYLPARASMDPLIEWGSPDTWGDFWRQVTAQGYQYLFGGADLGNHLVDGLIYAANQFGPWLGMLLLVPVVVGVAYLWRTDRGLLVGTALIALIDVVAALNYSIREIVTYYVPFYMIVLWWAGLGIAQGIIWFYPRIAQTSAGAPTRRTTPTAIPPAPAPAGTIKDQGGGRARGTLPTLRNPAILLVLGAVLPLVGLLANWGMAGHRDNYTGELFVRNAFKNFSENAVVLTNYWDLTSSAFYLQHVLNERRDVVIIDKSTLRNPFYLDYLERNYPDVVSKNAAAFTEYKALLREWVDTGRVPQKLPDAYIAALNGFIDTNLGQRPVYAFFVAPGSDVQERQEIRALFENRESQLVPDGFGSRIAVGPEDLRAHDPQFDLRGVTVDKVPLDEIEAATIALYPTSLQSIGAYMQNSQVPEDKEVGTRLVAQAHELQPLAPLRDARPRLRSR
jgi:hypothetical protein